MLLSRSTTRLGGLTQIRTKLRPPENLPFRGLYRTEGDTVRKDELLVNQPRFNYHPGLNVYYENDRKEKCLRAACDGVVRITREKIKPDLMNELMKKEYEYKKDLELYKFHFNVIPLEMSREHKLVNEI